MENEQFAYRLSIIKNHDLYFFILLYSYYMWLINNSNMRWTFGPSYCTARRQCGKM
jgi:hypothetical protein